jgi:hypothetical protein
LDRFKSAEEKRKLYRIEADNLVFECKILITDLIKKADILIDIDASDIADPPGEEISIGFSFYETEIEGDMLDIYEETKKIRNFLKFIFREDYEYFVAQQYQLLDAWFYITPEMYKLLKEYNEMDEDSFKLLLKLQ